MDEVIIFSTNYGGKDSSAKRPNYKGYWKEGEKKQIEGNCKDGKQGLYTLRTIIKMLNQNGMNGNKLYKTKI
jgi:hypothetical protein